MILTIPSVGNGNNVYIGSLLAKANAKTKSFQISHTR